MVLIQVLGEDDGFPDSSESKSTELLSVLGKLSARLALPQELLASFLPDEKPTEALATYRSIAEEQLGRILAAVNDERETWLALDVDQHAEVVMSISRLYGEDDWTSSQAVQLIDDIVASLDGPSIALHLLRGPLRSLYSSTSHPLLDPSTSRALPRPRGGADAHLDMQDDEAQVFKTPSAWGCYNVLRWCVTALSETNRDLSQLRHGPSSSSSSSLVEDNIGVILPPTLVMMDDWDPIWRGRGAWVLLNWLDLVPSSLLSRMRVDQLLLQSLLHTISLHPSPPLPHVLPATLAIVSSCLPPGSAARTDAYAAIIDKGVVGAWVYAPSGTEGRAVRIAAATDLSTLAGLMGTGIARWLKAIVPGLLEPLQYPPSPIVLPHFIANLSAMKSVFEQMKGTGRVARWRGQVLDVLARLWIQLRERKMLDDEVETARNVNKASDLVVDIVAQLEVEAPSIRNNELKTLASLDPNAFQPLIDLLPQLQAST